jgi:Spy/CpxP family protein refolding chaperone
MNKLMGLMLLLMGAPAWAHLGPRPSAQEPGLLGEARIERRLSRAGVDPSAVARLRPALLKFAEQLAPLRQNAWQARGALKDALASPKVDDAVLTRLTDQLSADRQQLQEIRAQEMEQLRRELTPAQYARLLVAQRAWGHRDHSDRGDRR